MRGDVYVVDVDMDVVDDCLGELFGSSTIEEERVGGIVAVGVVDKDA